MRRCSKVVVYHHSSINSMPLACNYCYFLPLDMKFLNSTLLSFNISRFSVGLQFLINQTKLSRHQGSELQQDILWASVFLFNIIFPIPPEIAMLPHFIVNPTHFDNSCYFLEISLLKNNRSHFFKFESELEWYCLLGFISVCFSSNELSRNRNSSKEICLLLYTNRRSIALNIKSNLIKTEHSSIFRSGSGQQRPQKIFRRKEQVHPGRADKWGRCLGVQGVRPLDAGEVFKIFQRAYDNFWQIQTRFSGIFSGKFGQKLRSMHLQRNHQKL